MKGCVSHIGSASALSKDQIMGNKIVVDYGLSLSDTAFSGELGERSFTIQGNRLRQAET